MMFASGKVFLLVAVLACLASQGLARPSKLCGTELPKAMRVLCPDGFTFNSEVPYVSKRCCEVHCSNDYLRESYCIRKSDSTPYSKRKSIKSI